MTTLYISEGGPKSGWYRPPKGTHGPGSQGGKDKPPTPAVPEATGVGTPPSAEGTDANNAANESFEDATEEGNWEDAEDEERGELKASIVDNVSAMAGVDPEGVNHTLRSWAHSSNDEDMRSLSIQQDAAAEFGVPLSDFTKGKIPVALARGGEAAERAVSSEAQRKSLRAMHTATQEWAESVGLSSDSKITLYRGVTVSAEVAARHKAGDPIPVEGNALSSWSTDKYIGRSFANREVNGISLSMDVPISSVLSTAITGLGCLTEGEVTVLGASGTAEVDWSTGESESIYEGY